MRDYLVIGDSPAAEDCVQLGSNDYDTRAREECKQFRELLRTKFGPEPMGARLAIKSFPHDFGNYLEVVCFYDDEFPDSEAYALACENDMPETWEDTTPVNWRKDLEKEQGK